MYNFSILLHILSNMYKNNDSLSEILFKTPILLKNPIYSMAIQ
jgi:hypothetical protein